MKQYLILIMGTGEGMAALPEEERQKEMAKWWAWDEELQKSGVKVSGEAVNNMSAMYITGKDKTVHEGYSADKPEHAVGGYYVIKADSMEDAVEIAKGCPTFDMDGTVEVKEVMELPDQQ